MGETPAPLAEASLGTPSIVPKAAERIWAAVPEGTSETGSVATLAAAPPTQVRRPWRATARTVFQALVSLAVLAPVIAAAVEEATGYDLEGVPFVAVVLGCAAALARVMAKPEVEVFLRRFIPFLSAAPKES